MSPTGPIPIRLILEGQNETVLTGSIRILSGAPDDVPGNATAAEDEEEYDYRGAMLFSVLVISVYAVSIVLLIASFIKKKQVLVSVEESKNVNQYLIQVSDLKEKTARENFKKLKRSIIEAVERSDSRQGGISSAPEGKGKGDNQAFKHAILGAGMSLYSPLIVIKEEPEGGEEGKGTRSVVCAQVESPRKGTGTSPQFLYPPSGSVTPESPAGSDRKSLLNTPTSSTTPTSPGTDSRRLLLDADSPSSPAEPPEPVWLTRNNAEPAGYRNRSFQPSPSPRLSRQKRVYDGNTSPESRQALLSDVWLPLSPSSRTPSPSRRSGSGVSQDNAVSSV